MILLLVAGTCQQPPATCPSHPGQGGKLHQPLNGFDSFNQATKHLPHVSPTLHGDGPQVILLPHPHQERLFFVVEYPSSCWPVTRCISCLKKSITLFKQKMICNQLILDLFCHACEWVVGSSMTLWKLVKSCFRFFFHALVLLLCHVGVERKPFNGAYCSYTG